MSSPEPEGVRLQKVLSKAGIASRRNAEGLIADGRVSVDGEVVTALGRRVDPDTAVIHVDGTRVVLGDDMVYLALNKPRGVLSAMSDDKGRDCVGDYLRAELGGEAAGVFHVGRLDSDTEGLLLLTNDGELGHRLMHPSYRVLKTYLAEVDGEVARAAGRALRDGVELEDGAAAADRFRVVDSLGSRTLVEIALHEGRNRIVRRMLDAVGHPVRRLVRTAVGDVRLDSLRPGAVRRLSREEVGSLHRAVEM